MGTSEVQSSAVPTPVGAPTALLRLWFVLFAAYTVAKLVFNLLAFGWIDLRPVSFLEFGFVPLLQCAVVWLITRRRRTLASAPA